MEAYSDSQTAENLYLCQEVKAITKLELMHLFRVIDHKFVLGDTSH